MGGNMIFDIVLQKFEAKNFRHRIVVYRRAKKTHNSTQRIQQAHVTIEDQVDDEHLFMESHLDKHPDSLTWLMDSGCTSHANLIMSFFISLDTIDNPRVKLGDRHSPRPKERASLDMVNDGYYLNLDVANTTAFTITQDDNMKWHKRFGHFNYRTLNHMYTTKLVKDICSKLGKSHTLPFSVSHVTRATHKLEIVHYDICGPMSTPSWSDNKYFFSLTIIQECVGFISLAIKLLYL
ncbi:hypothetical protein Tco_1398814 [Tanacetum coccineum]